MRRTDLEFKDEVLRRATEYKARRVRGRKKLLAGVCCLAVCILAAGVFCSGVSGGNKSAATADCAAQEAAVRDENGSMGFAAEVPGSGYGANPEDGMSAAGTNADGPAVLVRSQPEAKEFERCFTDPDTVQAILDAIGVFRAPDTPGEIIAGTGNANGLAYVITVTDEQGTREYTLFNGALYSAEDGCWLCADQEAYQMLEDLITQEGE